MSKVSRGIVAVGSLVVLTFGMSPANAARKPALDHTELCSPEDPSIYNLVINNPYFPLTLNSVQTYTGFDAEDQVQLGLRIEVTGNTQNIYSGAATIATRVVEELEWQDTIPNGIRDTGEPLIERSLNYFAQAEDGTVCYFGEAVDIYNENGVVVSHDGSWRADGRKNAPGIFMPANPQLLEPGTDWFMENAPRVAKDRATFEGVESRTVPAGTFPTAIRITDCNTIDRDCGTKFYAPNEGLIVDGVLELLP